MADTKVCSRCNNEWPVDGFSPDRTRDGLRSWCLACCNEYSKTRYRRLKAENPDAVLRASREAQARYRSHPENRDRERGYRRARHAAVQLLIEAHRAEFDSILDEELARRGLWRREKSRD